MRLCCKSFLIHRLVTEAEAESFARECGIQHIESSAKDNFHVADIFRNLIVEIEKFSGERAPDAGCVLL